MRSFSSDRRVAVAVCAVLGGIAGLGVPGLVAPGLGTTSAVLTDQGAVHARFVVAPGGGEDPDSSEVDAVGTAVADSPPGT